jgi:hypothetical protein
MAYNRTIAFLIVATSVVACTSAHSTDTPADTDGSETPAEAGDADARADNPDTCGTSGTPTGTAVIRVVNGTSGPLYGAANSWEPRWLRIGDIQFTGYGSPFCCGGGHNDPFFSVVEVAVGDAFEWKWSGSDVDIEGSCLTTRRVAPGPYAARACAYEEKPASFFDAGPTKERCIDFTVELPASGEKVTTATL